MLDAAKLRLLDRLRVGHGLVLVGFRLLLARALVGALHVVALFLRDFIGGFGLFLGDVVHGVRRALALGLELGLGDLLGPLGFLHADVLGVAAHGLALFLRGLVVGLDLFLVGAVFRARRHFGVLDRVGQRAAGRRRGGGARRLRRCQCRRAQQEGPSKGGVKSSHFHFVGLLMRFQSLDPLIALALGLEVADLLLGLVLRNPVGVLEAARELLAAAGDLVQLVVGQASPLLTDFALELLPVAFAAVPIHGVT